ncbi:Ig-like domain-containing protein, partial [Corynebacterium sp. CCM 9186]
MSLTISGFRRDHKRTAGVLLSLALACGVSVAAPPSITPQATAAENCIVDDLQWNWKGGESNKLNGGPDATADVEFDWSLSDPVNASDQFVVSLPEELKPLRKSELTLHAPGSDEVVATGIWDSGSNKATFTLTEYAEKHSNLRGTTWFTVTWNDWTQLPKEDKDYTSLPFNSCVGNSYLPAHWVAPTEGGVFQAGGKVGYLSDEQPAWVVYLGTAKQDIDKPVVITDTTDGKWAPNCDQISVMNRTPYPHTVISDVPVDSSRWTLDSCNESGFSLRFIPLTDGRYLLKNESLMISYTGKMRAESGDSRYLDNEFSVTGIDNNGSPSDEGDSGQASIDRGGSGGSGIGDKSVSVGDFVFYDVNGNGIQDPEDLPIPGIKLKIQNIDGTDVTKDFRNQDYSEVKENITRTDQSGRYLFTGLPFTKDGEVGRAYTVSIDRDDEQTRNILAKYTPTLTGKGDIYTDSSTWTANSKTLTREGERDFSLDFGFIKKLDDVVP